MIRAPGAEYSGQEIRQYTGQVLMKRQTPVLRRRRVWIVVALVVCFAIGFGTWFLIGDELPGSPVNPGTPLPASTVLTAEERAFYEYVGPRLRAVTAESEVLVSLGQARSRNVIELRRRGDRVNDISTQIDSRIESSGVPERFVVAMNAYKTGIEAVRTAEAATRSALRSFDWDAIARAVDVMAQGTRELQNARQALEQAAGKSVDGTPVSMTGTTPANGP